MIIAIDGPAGSGKTTTARKVAQILGFIHINTGAMYRGIALKFIREKVNLDDTSAIERILNNTQLDFAGPNNAILYMDGEDISTEIISSMVTENVSQISSISEVRVKLVEYQRKMARGRNVVLEGRDIGTVVFPNADYKFYLVADIEVRAERRKQEIEVTGDHMTKEEIIMFIKDRDKKDSSRQHSPLMKAEDAIEVDTTDLKIEEQVNYIINIVNYNQKGA
jgi:cytidylate kinase